MHKIFGIMALSGLGAGAALAGPEKVAFPEGYQSHFVRYTTVDNARRKKVRFLYVNPESLAKAKPNQPAPHGTVLVMEDHKAKLGADGKPLKDARGRFIPMAEITNVFVQEKQPGWGVEYKPDKRNGEWEYAWFEPTGKPRTGPRVNFDRCFSCHKEEAEFNDYTFTFPAFVAGMKK